MAVVLAFGTMPVAAQDSSEPRPPAPRGDAERLHITLQVLAGYGHDASNATLGFEKQGRIGYAIVTLEGRLNGRAGYRLSINPVDEVSPRPACGEPGFFFPNDPARLYGAGPAVPCDVRYGHRRVDMYRGIALDTVNQNGPVREGFIRFDATPRVQVTFGKFVLPVGFGAEHAGSFTAKDATFIQRINAESNFGVKFGYARTLARWRGRIGWGAVMGDGNRFKDYDYFYFQDGSLDTNSALTMFAGGALSSSRLEVRVAFKKGFTGSKVERLPSYWASKRHDDAAVLSAEFRPTRYVRVLGEWARYRWGPTRTSAEMLGMSPAPIYKQGAYATVEGRIPLRAGTALGGSWTYERIDRADSLIRFLAEHGMLNVVEGRHDGNNAARVFMDLGGHVRLGYYVNSVSNPYAWVSAIEPTSRSKGGTSESMRRWGLTVHFQVR
jgi:hypothetical protein